MLVNQKENQNEKLHTTSIYLYNYSIYNHMCNEELHKYAREGKIWLFGNYNAGTASINKNVNFSSIECWINKEVIYNISSTQNPKEVGFYINYDTRNSH